MFHCDEIHTQGNITLQSRGVGMVAFKVSLPQIRITCVGRLPEDLSWLPWLSQKPQSKCVGRGGWPTVTFCSARLCPLLPPSCFTVAAADFFTAIRTSMCRTKDQWLSRNLSWFQHRLGLLRHTAWWPKPLPDCQPLQLGQPTWDYSCYCGTQLQGLSV